jgi:hypothetical protein
MSEIQPALLTRAEIDWLLGNKEVSKLYERKIRYSIKKKIETLTELEIPLLRHRGFNVTTYSNGVTTGGNAAGLEEPSLVRIPLDYAAEEHYERVREIEKESGGPKEIRTPDPRHVKAVS